MRSFFTRALKVASMVLLTTNTHAQTSEDTRLRADLTRDTNAMAECAGLYSYSADMLRKTGKDSDAIVFDRGSTTFRDAAGLMRLLTLRTMGDTCNVDNACDPTTKVFRYVDEWKANGRSRIDLMVRNKNDQGIEGFMQSCLKLLDKANYMLQAKRDAADLETGPNPTGLPQPRDRN